MLTFVTSNANKLKEVQSIIGNSIEMRNEGIELEEIQGTTREIGIAKCKLAAMKVNGSVITEDTCLCFDALGGLPGPYVKHFLDKLGPDGLFKLLQGWDNKKGWALTTFCYTAGPGQEVLIFEGRTDGIIVEPRGPLTFGWDPIFLPDGFTETYSEMTKEIKNTISHRGKATQKLKEYLLSL